MDPKNDLRLNLSERMDGESKAMLCLGKVLYRNLIRDIKAFKVLEMT